MDDNQSQMSVTKVKKLKDYAKEKLDIHKINKFSKKHDILTSDDFV